MTLLLIGHSGRCGNLLSAERERILEEVRKQELDDEDRQARFGRRRPDGFAVNEKEHLIYILEFKGRLLPKGHRHPPTHPPTHPHIQWMCSIVGIST